MGEEDATGQEGVSKSKVRGTSDKTRKAPARYRIVPADSQRHRIHLRRIDAGNKMQICERDERGTDHIIYERTHRVPSNRGRTILEFQRRVKARRLIVEIVRENRFIMRAEVTRLIAKRVRGMTYRKARWLLNDMITRRIIHVVERKDGFLGLLYTPREEFEKQVGEEE